MKAKGLFRTRYDSIFLALTLFATTFVVAGGDLEKDFLTPPDTTKPRCYWYWMDDRITREGITKDLEAMKHVGIGEGYIGIIGGQSGLDAVNEPKTLSDNWWGLIEHAIREGGRLGVDIGFFNSPGWSQSGGPWVKPTQAMRYVELPEFRLHGPQHFEGRLPVPAGEIQDLAVLAFPAPLDGTNCARIADRAPTHIQFATEAPFTARSLWVQPVKEVNVSAELKVSDDGQTYRAVKRFQIDRHNLSVQVGSEPLAPVVTAFPAVTARFYRLDFSSPCEVGDVRLSPEAKVADFAGKSLFKVFQDPHPPYDFYTWPPPETEVTGAEIAPAEVLNLSKYKSSDGTLRWDVPAGDWVVLRAVMAPTGTKNSPAPPEATGYEVDKMNRTALKAHFEAYVGELLRRMPASERTAWKHVVADSYEQGPENWTDGFAEIFREQYGYDPLPWLPVMTGRVVGSADQSDRFLWDLRRLVADRIAQDYVGGLRDLCHQHGLKMWLENYGHWGFPAEFLQYGGASDEVSGEFWANGDYDDPSDFGYLGRVELPDAASAAHIYGKRQVFAEAFTGGPPFINTPRTLKARGDWAFCEGINQFVFHVYIHQPWEDKSPGVNAWFGTEFNRHNTWFAEGKPWVDYLRRCSVMLQTGQPVADVAYCIGEDTPKMTGQRQPALPPGCDYDYINAEVIEKSLTVKNGRLSLPFGLNYRVLVLPNEATMRPKLLRKIRDLIQAGATVVGTPPSRSPSLQDFPKGDQQVCRLAQEIWGGTNVPAAGERLFGKGRVIWGKSLETLFAELNIGPDFISCPQLRFKHRREGDTDIYFVANPEDQPIDAVASFRVAGKRPEIWWPDTGQTTMATAFEIKDGVTSLPLRLGPTGSLFVVFRHPIGDFDPIVAVTRDGRPVLPTKETAPRIVIESARYGILDDPHRTRDVRAKVQALMDGGRTSFQVGALATGDDPAYGVVKTLGVKYTVAGQVRQATGQDPDRLNLVHYEALPVIDITQGEIWRSGDYVFQTATGKRRSLEVSLPAPLQITGPWQVSFAPGWGAPAETTFDQLMDWTTSSNPCIKYFSGHATYRKIFELPSGLSATDESLILDLGEVDDLAVVSLNGQKLATLWHAPWRVDVTAAVHPGTNSLEIIVVNPWNNRLAGDAALPPAQRHTYLSTESFKPGATLLPAGLLGPVTLQSVITLKSLP